MSVASWRLLARKIMPNVFINLSNHSSDKWTVKQMEAARVYGDVIDWPFPKIDASWDSADVYRLAVSYFQRITEFAPADRVVVHIMGEMTFCFTLVSMLKSNGYRCVASTSERRVVEKQDGVKEVTFDFERFRCY